MELRMHLTGAIGSGKSSAAQLLHGLGWHLIEADLVGHEILAPGGAAEAEVAARWPDAVVDGEILRSRLADIVFADPGELAALEAITHPAIGQAILDQATGKELVVVEAALLDVGFKTEEWITVVVDVADEVAGRRLRTRGMSDADIDRRRSAQPSRQRYLDEADYVVDNSGTDAELATAIGSLHVALTGSP